MKSKEFIEKAKNSILNRVRFHAPIVFDSDIDKRVLFENGIDARLPLFKFQKLLTKNLLKAFKFAQDEENFMLVLSTNSLKKIKDKQLKTLKNVVVFSPQNSSVRFLEMINKLNINYQSSSNYNLVFKDKFVKICGLILNPKYDDFCLKQMQVYDDLWFDYHEFVLNGTNFFVQMKNVSRASKKVTFEINIPLEKGYYYFKKHNKYITIENLLTKQKTYFNFVCRNAKFSFSNVDGLENSVYCCINVKVTCNLTPREDKFLFFNLGDSKFAVECLSEIKKLEKIANKKCCEIFNVKVKTKNHGFDRFFNTNLPQKIWVNWLNGTVDESMENKYLTLKRLFVRGREKIDFVPFKEIGLKEIGVFNGEYFKKVLVVNSADKFLRVGKTQFFNINGITNFSLKSKEPIELSFGDV